MGGISLCIIWVFTMVYHLQLSQKPVTKVVILSEIFIKKLSKLSHLITWCMTSLTKEGVLSHLMNEGMDFRLYIFPLDGSCIIVSSYLLLTTPMQWSLYETPKKRVHVAFHDQNTQKSFESYMPRCTEYPCTFSHSSCYLSLHPM